MDATFDRFNRDPTQLTDAYVEIRFDDQVMTKTNVILDSLNPVWNAKYRIDMCHSVHNINLVVFDKDNLTVEKIGVVKFRARDLLNGIECKDEAGYPIKGKAHMRERGRLFASVRFVPIDQIREKFGIDGYFAMHRKCKGTIQ